MNDSSGGDALLWQQVHWLGAIAGAGSLTAAAQQLGVSKAAVSQQLAALERRIGVPLVRRTTRSLRLTEAGALLVERSAPAFAAIADSVVAVHDLADTPRGLVRLTAPVALGRQHIAPLLLDFLRLYPQIRVELDLSDRVLNLAQDGFDLAVRHVAAPPPSHVAWKLCPTRTLLLASHDYLQRRGVPRQPRQLADHDCLIYLRGPGTRWMFEHEASGRREQVLVTGAFSANNSEVLREAVLDGRGIALLPDFSVPVEARQQLRQLLPRWQAVGVFGDAIHALRPWSPTTPRAVRLLVEHLRAGLKRGFGAPPSSAAD